MSWAGVLRTTGPARQRAAASEGRPGSDGRERACLRFQPPSSPDNGGPSGPEGSAGRRQGLARRRPGLGPPVGTSPRSPAWRARLATSPRQHLSPN
ncbi:collagen alpha-1(I) chain-like [Harpia harpyja]|uniref:collagen alpha-1(I) chain-like n=1 Tax=Harpia harpyja TaxID=202280 RepID=UPI0022B18F82|nr:collagen alpha-1(I) chain-like [Harpia harpyja]